MSSTTSTVQPALVQTSDAEVGSHDVIQAPNPPVVVNVAGVETPGVPGGAGTVQDVLQRDVLLFTQDIATTDTVWLNMLGDFDPWALWLSNTYVNNVLKQYQLIRCDLHITVRANVPGSCFGAYNIQCLCDGGRAAVGTQFLEMDGAGDDSPWNSVQDVHGVMNCELSNMVEFDLPFVSDMDAIPTAVSLVDDTSWPHMWRMLLFPMVALTSTVGTTAAGTLQFYARASGPVQVFNPQLQGKKPTTKEYPVQQKRGRIGAGLALGQTVADKLATVPMLAPFAAPAGAFMGAASKIADLFGFTREAAPREPQPIVQRAFSSLAPVDTLDSSEVVALFAGNAVGIGPQIGGGSAEDPSALGSLFERWTIVATYDYGSESTAQTVLGRLPVTPSYAQTTLGVRYFTTAGYVGVPFEWWRGSMEYLVYVPSSSNMQGAVQVAWSPSCAQNPGTSDPTHKLCNVVMDLHGTSAVHVTVGYSARRPALSNKVLDSSSTLDANTDDVANGMLVFRCISPLTAPRAGPYATKIVVMARAGDDMVFGVPRSRLLWFDVNFYRTRDIRLQGNEGLSEEVQQETLVPRSQYNVHATLFGEQFLSVRALMQKFSSFYIYEYGDATDTDGGTMTFSHFPPPPTHLDGAEDFTYARGGKWAGNDSIPFTWLGWYSAPFTGIRGTTRWKFLALNASSSDTGQNLDITLAACPNGVINPGAVYNPYGPGNGGSAVTGPMLTNSYVNLDQQPCSKGRGAEFAMPYYFPCRYQLVRRVRDFSAGSFAFPDARADGFSVTGVGQGTLFDEGVRSTLSLVLDVYVAGGADVSVTRFRRIPGVLAAVP